MAKLLPDLGGGLHTSLLWKSSLLLCSLFNASVHSLVPDFGTASLGQASLFLPRLGCPPITHDHSEPPHICPWEHLTHCNYIITCELFKVCLSGQTYTPWGEVPPICVSHPTACLPQCLGYHRHLAPLWNEWLGDSLMKCRPFSMEQQGTLYSNWIILARWKSYSMGNNPII